jgi:hypothetical protein
VQVEETEMMQEWGKATERGWEMLTARVEERVKHGALVVVP